MNETNGSLPLVESFYSIQGEGCHAGKPAYFIRLGGCDVCCSFCDSRATWNAKRYPQVSIEDLVGQVSATPAQIVIITGGEPTLYDLTELCAALHERGFAVFLETSGAHPIVGDFDWICLSPKMNKPPLPTSLERANELKVVIQRPADFEWAEENAALAGDQCLLFLQPEWGVHEDMTPLIVEYIKQHPSWNISIQLHKYIDVP